LERWTPNHPQSSSLGTPHTSPSGAAIVGSMPKKPLSEWSLYIYIYMAEAALFIFQIIRAMKSHERTEIRNTFLKGHIFILYLRPRKLRCLHSP